MCPDGQLLSAYIDGELPPQWERRIGEHIETCERCSRRVEEFISLRNDLVKADIAVEEDRTEKAYHDFIVRRKVVTSSSFRHRKVTLPAPLAAAAAILITTIVALFFITGGYRPAGRAVATESEIIIPPEKVGIRTIDEAIRLFESQNAHIEIYIQLPAETNFQRLGEPLLIREADYQPGRM